MKIYNFWIDAKHDAREQSTQYGYAWIHDGPDGGFQVTAGETLEDAPDVQNKVEFMDGEEQE